MTWHKIQKCGWKQSKEDLHPPDPHNMMLVPDKTDFGFFHNYLENVSNRNMNKVGAEDFVVNFFFLQQL